MTFNVTMLGLFLMCLVLVGLITLMLGKPRVIFDLILAFVLIVLTAFLT